MPHDGLYRIAREMFTEAELFDLEMEQIFEKVWIYACHESEIPNNNDFVTVQIGRQPLIISRDCNGELHAMVNACEPAALPWHVSVKETKPHLPVPSMYGPINQMVA